MGCWNISWPANGFALIARNAAEDRYRLEPSHDLTPARIFDRRWALSRLQAECEAQGKGALFTQVKGAIAGETDDAPYARTARMLGLSEGAVRVAVHRLRQRYGELLRDEVAQTVSLQWEVDEELRWLLTVLRT